MPGHGVQDRPETDAQTNAGTEKTEMGRVRDKKQRWRAKPGGDRESYWARVTEGRPQGTQKQGAPEREAEMDRKRSRNVTVIKKQREAELDGQTKG